MQELKDGLKKTIRDLFNIDVEPELTRPQEQFGDWATNIAMQLGAKLDKNPREIAESLVSKIQDIEMVAKAEVAGPGFINIYLTDQAILDSLNQEPQKLYEGQSVVVEYSDPNPFKVLHVGHLYTSVVGDAIANLFESAGAQVARVNFGGDVGLHVAKAMWSILRKLGGENPEKLDDIPIEKRAEWLAGEYITGSQAYGDDENVDSEIKELNKKIYQIHQANDHQTRLAQIYWTTRQWSYDYFDKFYAQIGTHFDKYYPESETISLGLKAVKENIGRVFEESQGAIVFKGELHNMHTRVFINSQGLPTYETKDVGLIFKKWEDYHFDKSVVITGNDIYEYMQVVLKAVEGIKPELAQKTTHVTHGMVKLAGGEKMSSRIGNIVKAEDVLSAANEANKKVNLQENAEVSLGAVKYAFLKHRIGSDIIFDVNESVSLEGNSGPYLQYAHARACSILSKVQKSELSSTIDLQPGERALARKISEWGDVVDKSVAELMPHHICIYLYELAQVFNSFYEKNRVIGDSREALRLNLVEAYAQVLKSGLRLLNIEAPEHL